MDDYQGGSSAGMQVALLVRGAGALPAPVPVIRSLAELPGLLASGEAR